MGAESGFWCLRRVRICLNLERSVVLSLTRLESEMRPRTASPTLPVLLLHHHLPLAVRLVRRLQLLLVLAVHELPLCRSLLANLLDLALLRGASPPTPTFAPRAIRHRSDAIVDGSSIAIVGAAAFPLVMLSCAEPLAPVSTTGSEKSPIS